MAVVGGGGVSAGAGIAVDVGAGKDMSLGMQDSKEKRIPAVAVLNPSETMRWMNSRLVIFIILIVNNTPYHTQTEIKAFPI